MQKCKNCEQKYQKIKTKKFYVRNDSGRKRYYFKDENGERVHGNFCHKCLCQYYRNKNYEYEKVKKPRIKHGDIEKRKCKKCNIEFNRTFMKIKDRVFYKDQNNNNVRGSYCHECWKDWGRKYSYKTGRHKPIDQVLYDRMKKGRKAERIVEKYFNESGHKTTITNGKGPDLIIYPKNEKSFTVEIKSSYKSSNSWCVSKIQKNRKNDDFIAIVLPNNKIYFDTMAHHLSITGEKSGNRTITELVNKYGDKECL